MKLRDQLIRHEGLRLKPYLDTEGILTIGVGRNLDDRGISESEALHLLDNDINEVYAECSQFDWFETLCEVRQDTVANMVFNLGISRFKGFRKTIKAIQGHAFTEAAREMMDSKWARQVGRRARELAFQMRTGRHYDPKEE